jgi:putative transposase
MRDVTDTWLSEYNEERSHDSLGSVPPLAFLPGPETAQESNFKLCP